MKNEMDNLSAAFRALLGNQNLFYRFLDLNPMPLQVFALDGTCIFGNRAWFEFLNISDASVYVGKYNYNDDPVCLEILGQDVYDRVSRGEAVAFPDFPAPIQSAVDRGYIKKKPFEAATIDLFFQPLWDGDTYVCMVLYYFLKNIYKGRPEIAKAREYINEHWRNEFDLEKVARFVSLSSRHFRRIFKEVTAYTPNEYYQQVKLGKIEEKLLDGNLSIAQAFEACGADYNGKTYFNLFKEKNKMTPAEYRKKNNIQ